MQSATVTEAIRFRGEANRDSAPSLSYDIVVQGHGGTLAMESTEGEGATFVVTLPADLA